MKRELRFETSAVFVGFDHDITMLVGIRLTSLNYISLSKSK